MAKEIKYNITFESNLTSLKEARDALERIQKNSVISLDINSQTLGKKLFNDLNSAISQIESKIKSGKITQEDFLNFGAIYKELLVNFNKFKDSIYQLSVSPQFKQDLNEINAKIEAAQNKLRELKADRKNSEKGWIEDEDGSLTPTKAKKNQISSKISSEYNLTSANSNRIISLYDTIEKEVQPILKKVESGLTDALTPKEKDILAAWNDIQSKIDEEAKAAADIINQKRQEEQKQVAEINKLLEEKVELEKKSASALPSKNPELEKELVNFSNISNILRTDYTSSVNAAKSNQKKINKEINNTNKSVDKENGVFSKAVKSVVSYGTALQLVRSIYQGFINTITDMDKALTDMTVVTSLNREEAWELTNQLAELGKTTGMTSTEIANMTTKYLQQGKTLSDSIVLTEAAAKAARIAGISGEESIGLLTNAMNGFQMSASQAMEVSDKFAALAAASATDYEQLATGLSKVAAQANLAGLSMDFTLGLIAKGIEVTQEAPETIGTSLKTVIARMRELTDYGETLEDGVDVNRVETALSNIGVALLDENREFRDLEDVLTEVGQKWNSLNKNQQANVAVALAGTRQQSRLIAMMQDFDRTQELVNVSLSSSGATLAQHSKYMQGLEGAITNLTTSYQNLITNIMNSDIVISIVNSLSEALTFLSENSWIVIGVIGVLVAAFAPYLLSLVNTKIQLGLTSLAKLLNITITEAETNATEKQTEANKKASLGIFDLIAAIKAEIIARTKSLAGKSKELLLIPQLRKSIKALASGNISLAVSETAAATGAKLLKAALDSLLIGIIIGAIAALISLFVKFIQVIVQMHTETDENTKKWLAFFNVLSLFVPIIGVILVGVEAIVFVFNALKFIIEGLIITIKNFINLIKNIPVVGKFISSAVDFLSSWYETIVDWGKKIKEKMDETLYNWKSYEDSINEAKERIENNQVDIYDMQNANNSLSPLIEEYTTLSNKINKTAEDIERMQEIAGQVKEIDASLVVGNSVNIDKAQEYINNNSEEISKKVQENLNTAIKMREKAESKWMGSDEAIEDWNNNETMKAALSDYGTNFISNMDNVDSLTQSKAISLIEQTIPNYSFNNSETIQKEIEELANSFINMEDVISDGTLQEQLQVFQEEYNKLGSEGKEALSQAYTGLKDVLDISKDANGNIDQNIIKSLETLNLSGDQISGLKSAFVEAGGSEEEFNKKLQEILKTGGNINTLTHNIAEMGYELENASEFANALQSILNGSQQSILEDREKKISARQNIIDSAEKYKNGELTDLELYELINNNPELFADSDFKKAFYGGEDITETNAFKNYMEEQDALYKQELEQNKILAQAEIDRLEKITNRTEEEEKLLQSYQNQVDFADKLLDNLKYQDLYTSKLYNTAKNLTEEEKEYNKLLIHNNKLVENLSDSENINLDAYQKAIDNYNTLIANRRDFLNNENLKIAQESGAITILEDGSIHINDEEYKKLYENNREAWNWIEENQDAITQAYTDLEKFEKDLYNIREENLEKIIDTTKVALEEQKEGLEKQKENYENFWDSLDQLDEIQEKEQDRESLIKQISALSGANDSASKQQRKELMSQLNELNDELIESRKQEQRDQIQKSIEDKIENIENTINSLEDGQEELLKENYKTNELLAIIAKKAGISEEEIIKASNGNIVDPNSSSSDIIGYSSGGMVNYTGLALLHGTKNKPEAVLNSNDTVLLQNLIENLRKIDTSSFNDLNEANDFINIGSIIIQTSQLNSNQDFKNAGKILAEEFAKAVQKRGISQNVKK